MQPPETLPVFAQLPVSAQLLPYIECYWKIDAPYAGQVLQRLPADGRIDLIFSLADGSQRRTLDGAIDCTVQSRSYCLGAREKGFLFEQLGASRYIAVRFKPGGLAAFTRTPVHDLSNIFVESDCLWRGEAVRQLVETLDAAPSFTAQAALLDAHLAALLNAPPHLDRILYAVERLNSVDAPISLQRLAEDLNFSQKHTERLFSRYVGLRPNLYLRIARFHAAIAARGTITPARPRLSHLAVGAGFFDQAHFTREFKQFSGATPRQFFAENNIFVSRAPASRM
jgi:AraC-like DNA-binding protein